MEHLTFTFSTDPRMSHPYYRKLIEEGWQPYHVSHIPSGWQVSFQRS